MIHQLTLNESTKYTSSFCVFSAVFLSIRIIPFIGRTEAQGIAPYEFIIEVQNLKGNLSQKPGQKRFIFESRNKSLRFDLWCMSHYPSARYKYILESHENRVFTH